ncbi:MULTISPECIES: enoyl-CoA hydratase/isomerase family protein [unclassified Bacillus (in: firmicutes)]|uniref:enoyl-CoA hydratase/isomerase family protein n=1 Tax=unclassified Bacillus (in: firmicutes) TaxID=185979 RepID=UPI003000EDAB
MKDYSTLIIEISNNVGKIKLNRPNKGNSITLELAKELYEISEYYKNNEEVKVVVLEGNGKHFSVGGDLASFADTGANITAHLREVTVFLHKAINNFVSMKKPVIAIVNGTVAGAGIGLICSADIVIASEKAQFVMAYTKAGLTPDGASSYFLPRLIGMKKSLELTLLNRMISAEEAESWGLVTKVCKEEEIESEVKEIEINLVEGATEALGKAKALLYESFNNSLLEQMEYESLEISKSASTSEGYEGISAFLEKRKPNFMKKVY